MKKFILIALCFTFGLIAFGQSRRLSTTRTNASLKTSEINSSMVSYEPVVLRLGKVVELDGKVAYVKITSKFNRYREGQFYFYACNIKAQATAVLHFRAEEYGGVSAMDISDGACQVGDYVYMRFEPNAPENAVGSF